MKPFLLLLIRVLLIDQWRRGSGPNKLFETAEAVGVNLLVNKIKSLDCLKAF